MSALFIVPLVFVHSVAASLIILSLAVGTAMSANAIFYVVNIDLSRNWNATALGLMVSFNSISAFAAPALAGWLVDYFGNFNTVFVMMAVLALSSVIVVLAFHKPDTESTGVAASQNGFGPPHPLPARGNGAE